MPLSNDFANSRLEYLQNAIKNNNTVTAQFYPRFKRHYNEMFPFTEGSLFQAKIENPQQPVGSSTLKAPTLEMAKENLKTLLIPYVGDQADDIIKGFTEVQVYYYEEHFNEIQKELLKQIKTPTSKTSYLVNLKMVLANDKNRSNLSIFKEPEVEPKPKEKTKPKAAKREIAPILKTPSRPLERYFSVNKPQKITAPPSLQIPRIRSASSPKKPTNLKKTMSKQRRSETDNLQHDTHNILTPNSPYEDFAKELSKYVDTGKGIQKSKKIFTGRGIQSREIKHKKEFHKFAIDLKKLRHNILALKYLKNVNNVANKSNA